MNAALLRHFSALAFSVLFSLGAAGTAGTENIPELYRYCAVPSGSGDSEEILVELSGVEYRSYNSATRESVMVSTDEDGALFEGALLSESSGRNVRLWEQNGYVIIERSGKRRARKIPEGTPAAADGSLLILFRRLLSRGTVAANVFMVDFTGVTVTAGVRVAGAERVSVPAGSFDCRRIEVSVKVPLLRPKVTFWLSEDPPHFMVRHQGKRGPFSSTYTTVLLERLRGNGLPDMSGSSPATEN
ncbi:MAG TPA: hypothetical protein PK587_13130 [Syntrophales bacterium]|nr:hypothetical protein [Syntrophales bacterium]